MKARCRNKKDPAYPNYGGRGIDVCELWKNSFMAFYEDMGPKPSDDHCIERIDNEGNYEPGNCRWATPAEQGINKRNNVMLTYKGETLCMTHWQRKLGLRDLHYYHLVRGMSLEEIIARQVPPAGQ